MNHHHGLLVVLALGLCGCTGAEFNSDGSSANKPASQESPHGHHADADNSRVMGSIDIAAGQHAGDVSTVNGGIHIGESAVVGQVETINGGITVEPHATAATAETVNGGIHINDGVGISGHVATVNGAISVGAAHIGGNISVVNGDLQIGPNAQVDGGIHVQQNNSWFQLGSRVPRVVIAPGSVVKGALKFDRKVLLYVSDHATVGDVQGATVNRFSGDTPPG